MKAKIPAIAAALLVTATAAQAFLSDSRLRVYPLDQPGTFEVVERPGSSPRAIWCAAGDYARSKFRVSLNQRIYILKGSSPSVNENPRRSVAFTLNPTQDMINNGGRPGDGGDFSVSTKKVGFNITTGKAWGFCDSQFRFLR